MQTINYTKYVRNNSTAVHILGHEGRSSKFSGKGKLKLKKSMKEKKKDENAQKRFLLITKFFTILERSIFIHTNITCMKYLKYDLLCVKCTNFA